MFTCGSQVQAIDVDHLLRIGLRDNECLGHLQSRQIGQGKTRRCFSVDLHPGVCCIFPSPKLQTLLLTCVRMACKSSWRGTRSQMALHSVWMYHEPSSSLRKASPAGVVGKPTRTSRSLVLFFSCEEQAAYRL